MSPRVRVRHHMSLESHVKGLLSERNTLVKTIIPVSVESYKRGPFILAGFYRTHFEEFGQSLYFLFIIRQLFRCFVSLQIFLASVRKLPPSSLLSLTYDLELFELRLNRRLYVVRLFLRLHFLLTCITDVRQSS